MTADDGDELGLLAAVGLSELEERIYRDLIRWERRTLADIAKWARISPRRAREVLSSLEEKGLLSRSAKRPIRYLPTPAGPSTPTAPRLGRAFSPTTPASRAESSCPISR